MTKYNGYYRYDLMQLANEISEFSECYTGCVNKPSNDLGKAMLDLSVALMDELRNDLNPPVESPEIGDSDCTNEEG